MKVTIEIWQSEFNGEWNCDIRTTQNNTYDETEYWSVENFVALLNLVSERFPKAKCVQRIENDAREE